MISDIDGTLVESRKLPTERTIAAISRLAADHVPLLLASGRHPKSVYGLFRYLGAELPFVASNGNYIDDLVSLSQLINPFSHKMVDECLLLAAENSACAIFAQVEQGYMCVGQPQWLRKLLWEYSEPECETVTPSDIHSTIASISHCHLMRQAGWHTKPSVTHGTIVGSEAEYLTVTPRDVDKATGVSRILKNTKDVCIVIGDGENDLTLFNLPNAFRIAISGGHPALIESADRVAPAANEDGFAWIMYNIVRPIMKGEISYDR